MRIIVCGANMVGRGIVQYLASKDIDVIVIDNDRGQLDALEEVADVQTIHAYPCHPSALEAADAREASMLIAVTSSDEVNVVACQVAHSLFDVPVKVAHLRGENYLNPKWNALFSKDHIPIDAVISPEKEIANSIFRSLEVPGAIECLPVFEDIYLICVRCLPGSSIKNTPLSHFSILFPDLEISIQAFIRDQKLIVPKLSDVFQLDDYVYFFVKKKDINKAVNVFGHNEEPLRDVIILGAGSIGRRLAQVLLEKVEGISVHLIESNGKTAELAAQELPKALVLKGDGLDNAILQEANIANAQAVVAVTSDHEVNLLSSLMSKRLGALRTISIVNGQNYSSLVRSLDIDVVVSPRCITISSILSHVRRGKIRSAHMLLDEAGELLEIEVLESSSLCGENIGQLCISKNLKVGLICRRDQIIFPSGKETIQAGDRLFFVMDNNSIDYLDHLIGHKGDYFS